MTLLPALQETIRHEARMRAPMSTLLENLIASLGRHGAVAICAWVLTLPLAASGTTISVTNAGDLPNGGTLRAALLSLNGQPGASHTVDFRSQIMDGRTIFLTQALPAVDLGDQGSVSIIGSNVPSMSIVKDVPAANFEIFNVQSGRATLVDLDISGGEFIIGQNAELSFDYDYDFEIADDITGQGRLIKEGEGVVTLTGDNDWSGGTEIDAGVLRGDDESLQGDIRVGQGSGLVFDIQDLVGVKTFDGDIRGLGALFKDGPGTLRLEGVDNDNLSGGTVIRQGTLIVSDDNLDGEIVVGALGTLELFQDGINDGEYEDAILGDGRVVKSGDAELTLSGLNSFRGGLWIADGNVRGNTTSIPGDVVTTTASSIIFDQDFDGSHLGNVSGTGKVVKDGIGTVTLLGTNTQTGGSQVLDGRLVGNTQSLQNLITLADGAEVEFSVAGNETFSGQVANLTGNAGHFIKSGAGTLTVDSTLAHDGTTSVTQGTLRMNTDLTRSSLVDISSGAAFVSSGIIAGDLDARGGVSSGSGKQTLTVGGNATFRDTSNLLVTADDQGNASLVDVAGNVNVLGGNVDISIEPGDYSAGVTSVIVQSGAGPVGGTGFQTTSPAYAFADITTALVGNEVQLSVTRNAANVGAFAGTQNQTNTAVAFNELLADGSADVANLEASLIALTVDEVPAMLDSLQGEAIGAFFNARLNNAENFAQSLARRFSVEPLHFEHRPRAEGDAAIQSGPPTHPARSRMGLGAWIEPFGVFGSNDGKNVTSDIESQIYGVTTGLDYRMQMGLRFGASFGYTRTHIGNTTGLVKGDGNTYNGGLFAVYRRDLFHLGAVGRYGYSDLESRRSIAFGSIDRVARGDTTGQDYSAYGELEFHLGKPDVILVHPIATYLYTHLDQKAFDETGADSLNLAVAKMEVDSHRISAGVRMSREFELGTDWSAEPELLLAWGHDFGDLERNVGGRFLGANTGGAFTTAGALADRNRFLMGVGYVMRIRGAPAITTHYRLSVGEFQINHGISVGGILNW